MKKENDDMYVERIHDFILNCESIEPEYKDLSISMLNIDPEKRPKAIDILSHKWLRKFKDYQDVVKSFENIKLE